MKRAISALILAAMLLALCACGPEDPAPAAVGPSVPPGARNVLALAASPSPAQAAGVPVVKFPLAAGWRDYYAIRPDGTLITWGSQEFGGFEEDVPFGQARELMKNAAAVYTSGRGATLAVDNDGGLWAFNTSQFNDTVPGVDYQWERDEMKPVKIMDDVAMAAMDQFHSVILKRDGTLWVNGCGSFGAPWLHKDGSYLVKIMDNVIWTDLHYAVTAGHELWGWRMTGTDDQPPRKLADLEEGVLQASWAGLALTERGNVYHWDVDSETGAIGRVQMKLTNGNVAWCRGKLALMDNGGLYYYVEDFIPGRPGWENPENKGGFEALMDGVAYAAQGEQDILAIKRDGSLWKLSPEEGGGWPGERQTQLGTGFYVSFGADTGLVNFSPTASYRDGQFTDVKADDWFADNVKTAFELGLMKGNSPDTFAPGDAITVAEAVTVAARVWDTYYGEGHDFTVKSGQLWYQPYVDYAKGNGLLTAELTWNYSAPATRAHLAWLLWAALGDEMDIINHDLEFSDVGDSGAVNVGIIRLAWAGVVGGKGDGVFDPEGPVLRCEAAAMLSRALKPELRLKAE